MTNCNEALEHYSKVDKRYEVVSAKQRLMELAGISKEECTTVKDALAIVENKMELLKLDLEREKSNSLKKNKENLQLKHANETISKSVAENIIGNSDDFATHLVMQSLMAKINEYEAQGALLQQHDTDIYIATIERLTKELEDAKTECEDWSNKYGRLDLRHKHVVNILTDDNESEPEWELD